MRSGGNNFNYFILWKINCPHWHISCSSNVCLVWRIGGPLPLLSTPLTPNNQSVAGWTCDSLSHFLREWTHCIYRLSGESLINNFVSQKNIIKTFATRCHILRLECTKFDFNLDCAPDVAGGAYSAPQTQKLHLTSYTFKEKKEKNF